jgi:hypothetical protein
MVFERIWR